MAPFHTNNELPVIKVDLKLKAAYLSALGQLKATDPSSARGWLKRYQLVEKIITGRPPLYLAGLYPTEAAFFKGELGESRQSVYRNLRVAKYASADDIERYSASRLNLAIAYAEAVSGGPQDRIAFDRLKIRRPGTKGRALEHVTLAELRDSLATVVGRTSALPQVAIDAIDAAKSAGARATVVRKHLVVRVPLGRVTALVRALAALDFSESLG